MSRLMHFISVFILVPALARADVGEIRVEAALGYLYQSSESYNWVPNIGVIAFQQELSDKWSVAPRLDALVAQDPDDDFFPAVSIYVDFYYRLNEKFTVAPGAGYGLWMESNSTKGFPAPSATFYWHFTPQDLFSGIQLDRILFRYSYAAASVETSQFFLGTSIQF